MSISIIEIKQSIDYLIFIIGILILLNDIFVLKHPAVIIMNFIVLILKYC